MNKKEMLIIEILKSRKSLENNNLKKINDLAIECFDDLKKYVEITNENEREMEIVEDQLFLLNKYINIYDFANSINKNEKTLRKIKKCISICKDTINSELKKIA